MKASTGCRQELDPGRYTGSDLTLHVVETWIKPRQDTDSAQPQDKTKTETQRCTRSNEESKHVEDTDRNQLLFVIQTWIQLCTRSSQGKDLGEDVDRDLILYKTPTGVTTCKIIR